MLKRKIEDILLTWKQEENHKPIVIKGCRQDDPNCRKNGTE